MLFPLYCDHIQNGDILRNLLPIDCQEGVERDAQHSTASCTVICDAIGDSKLILADMDIHKTIDSQMVNFSVLKYLRTAFMVAKN